MSDHQNFASIARRETPRLLAATEAAEHTEIRCHTLPTQVAPVQVGDPRKQVAGKKSPGNVSPNTSNDQNRITALDEMDSGMRQGSTRAETQLLRGTTRD